MAGCVNELCARIIQICAQSRRNQFRIVNADVTFSMYSVWKAGGQQQPCSQDLLAAFVTCKQCGDGLQPAPLVAACYRIRSRHIMESDLRLVEQDSRPSRFLRDSTTDPKCLPSSLTLGWSYQYTVHRGAGKIIFQTDYFIAKRQRKYAVNH